MPRPASGLCGSASPPGLPACGEADPLRRAILLAHVWWTGPAVIALTVPLAMLAVRLGQRAYKANKEAEKHTRRADCLSTVLTERGPSPRGTPVLRLRCWASRRWWACM